MKEEKKDETREVNRAARHDDPEPSPAGEAVAREAEKGQVKPTQGEPLQPLDPGGIGG